MKLILIAALTALALAAASPARAQNPTPVSALSGVSWTDTDNSTLAADGVTPIIDHYELHFVPAAGCAAVALVNLGKPAPDVNGVQTMKPIAQLGTIPANCNYTGIIAAIGPGGEGDSPASAPFVRVQAKVPAAPAKPTILPQ